MFYLSYTKESSLKGTIKFTKECNPRYSGIGIYTDVNGQRWDVEAVIGNEKEIYICAVKLEELHPYYKDTSGYRNYGMLHQTWEPYKMEIV